MLSALALFTVFITASLLTVALLWQREDPIGARVRSLGRHKPRHEPSDLARPFADRVILPALAGLAGLVSAVLPARLLEEVRHKLAMAGATTSLNAFLVQWALLALLFPLLFLALLLLSGSAFGAAELFILAGLALLGAAVPYLWLNMRIHRRQRVIWRSLPDAFDLITTSVEAGLGLDAALGRVAEKVPGPFASELDITLREIVMGRPRRDALGDLSTRTGIDDLSAFVNAILQAEQMGVSIGQVLRVQSEQLRVRRKQRAEQAGRRAAILMIFPVIVFNLPALFLVAIGPAAIEIVDLLGGK